MESANNEGMECPKSLTCRVGDSCFFRDTYGFIKHVRCLNGLSAFNGRISRRYRFCSYKVTSFWARRTEMRNQHIVPSVRRNNNSHRHIQSSDRTLGKQYFQNESTRADVFISPPSINLIKTKPKDGMTRVCTLTVWSEYRQRGHCGWDFPAGCPSHICVVDSEWEQTREHTFTVCCNSEGQLRVFGLQRHGDSDGLLWLGLVRGQWVRPVFMGPIISFMNNIFVLRQKSCLRHLDHVKKNS